METTVGLHKPRILVLENAVAVTGGIISVIRSCLVLRKEFDFIFVVPRQSAASPYVRNHGFEVQELPMLEIGKNLISLFLYGPVLLSNVIRFSILIRKNRIEVIHANDFYNLIPPLYRLLFGKVPYLCYVRFMPSKFPSVLVRFWCFWHRSLASCIVTVSKAVQRELPMSSVIIGNELPLEEIDHVPSSSRILLYPANFIRGKGQENAIRSFVMISNAYPEWKLRFVGSDMGLPKNAEFKKELMVMTSDLGVQDKVEWCDFSNDMMHEYLNSSIVLNFSESESFSLTCLEALFYGRPVIASDSGGPSEIVDQNESGLIIQCGNVLAMSQALGDLMKDQFRRQQMGILGRNRVRDRFSVQQTTYLLRERYRSILATS